MCGEGLLSPNQGATVAVGRQLSCSGCQRPTGIKDGWVPKLPSWTWGRMDIRMRSMLCAGKFWMSCNWRTWLKKGRGPPNPHWPNEWRNLWGKKEKIDSHHVSCDGPNLTPSEKKMCLFFYILNLLPANSTPRLWGEHVMNERCMNGWVFHRLTVSLPESLTEIMVYLNAWSKFSFISL